MQNTAGKHINNFILWNPSHGRGNVRRPTRNYFPQLYTDTGQSLEEQPEAIDDRDTWPERERERERERECRENPC